MTAYFDSKDPLDTDTFMFDYGPKLLGADIVSATVTVDDPTLHIDAPATFLGNLVSVVLSGGVLTTTYVISSDVMTSDGRTLSRSAMLLIETK